MDWWGFMALACLLNGIKMLTPCLANYQNINIYRNY